MKTLIVYYSLEGNTRLAAERIAERIGADTLRLAPKKAYADKGFAKFFWGGKSAVMAEAPALLRYRPRPLRSDHPRLSRMGRQLRAAHPQLRPGSGPGTAGKAPCRLRLPERRRRRKSPCQAAGLHRGRAFRRGRSFQRSQVQTVRRRGRGDRSVHRRALNRRIPGRPGRSADAPVMPAVLRPSAVLSRPYGKRSEK